MVVPRTAAWAIHRAYPVARERTVAADIESMARKMAAMRRMLLQRFFAIAPRRRPLAVQAAWHASAGS
jgi:hypothetical protein